MTCILGYLDNAGTLYMAADGRCTGSSSIYSDSHQKIVCCGDWLVGASGESLVTSLIAENAEALGAKASAFALGQEIRALLKAQEWVTEHESCGSLRYGVSLLIRRAGELHVALSNLSLVPVAAETFMGVGSGSDYGIGAATALSMIYGLSTIAIFRRSFKCAAMNDSAVGGIGYMYTVESSGEVDLVRFEVNPCYEEKKWHLSPTPAP